MNPYIAEDDRSNKSWQILNDRIKHIPKNNKINLKTNINKGILASIKEIATNQKMHINQLLIPEIKRIMGTEAAKLNTKRNSKDNVEFRTTFEKTLLEGMKTFASENKISLSVLIELSMKSIINEQR